MGKNLNGAVRQGSEALGYGRKQGNGPHIDRDAAESSQIRRNTQPETEAPGIGTTHRKWTPCNQNPFPRTRPHRPNCSISPEQHSSTIQQFTTDEIRRPHRNLPLTSARLGLRNHIPRLGILRSLSRRIAWPALLRHHQRHQRLLRGRIRRALPPVTRQRTPATSGRLL